MILWSEETAQVHDPEEEAALLQRGKDIAREHSVYIALTYDLLGPIQQNKLVLVTPQGDIGIDYIKAHPVPFVVSNIFFKCIMMTRAKHYYYRNLNQRVQMFCPLSILQSLVVLVLLSALISIFHHSCCKVAKTRLISCFKHLGRGVRRIIVNMNGGILLLFQQLQVQLVHIIAKAMH